MLILHHDWDSLQSMKVRMCLEEKGLAFDSRIVELTAFEHLRPDYLAINGAGLVPSLVDGGLVITESTIINEYLEDCVPTGLRPVGPLQRARMRAWTKFQDDEVHPSIRPATFQLMIRRRLSVMTAAQIDALVASHPLPQRAAAFREWATGEIDYAVVLDAIARLDRVIARMEVALADLPWLAGDTFSLADIAMASFVDRMEHLGLAYRWSACPGVMRWVGALKCRPAYSRALPAESARLPGPLQGVSDELRRRAPAAFGAPPIH